MSGHDEYLDLAAAHALGCLDDADRRTFEEHLAGCDTCRDALARFADDASMLAGAATPATPRPELKERILGEARIAVAALAVLGFWRRVQSDRGLQSRLAPLRLVDDAVVEIAAGEGFLFAREDLEGVAAASAFWHRAETDMVLKNAVRNAAQHESPRDEVMRIAAEAGFEFDDEHLSAVMTGAADQGGDAELSDAELEQVAAAGTPLVPFGTDETFGDALKGGATEPSGEIPGFP